MPKCQSPVSDKEARAKEAVRLLNPVEREVLRGIVAGASNWSIASDLDITAQAVARHRESIMRKLDARVTADVVRVGIYAGLDLAD